jgi:hypothetical protein
VPRPELGLLEERQLDRSCRPALRLPPRDLEEPLDDGLPLVSGCRPIDEGEDVEIAGRSKPAEDGGAVEVRADKRGTEAVAEDRDDLVGESLVLAPPVGGVLSCEPLARGCSVGRWLSDERCPRSRAG